MSEREGFIGEYQVLRELGRGGMGVVYLALDPRLGREVAIKLMTEFDEEALARFQTEAVALARLSHPGVVAIHSAGVAAGRPYLVMDRVEGGSLQDRLERQGPLGFSDAAGIVRDMARALEHAHEQGILHRDLKPENVLLGEGGQPRVTDFGLARDESAEKERLTRTGQTLGTVGYMPPEQALGERERIDRRSDVYSLGATLYALLTGRAPFVGTSALVVLDEVVTRAPERPSTLRPGLPQDLEAVCLCCLAKAPEDRYASAGALAEDLERHLRGEPVLARRVRSRRARRGLALLGAALLALLGVSLAASWLRGGEAHASRLSDPDLSERSRRLSDQTQALLREEGLFAREVERIESLTSELDLLEVASTQASPSARRHLSRARAGVRTLVGLLRLSEGDLPGARACLGRVEDEREAELLGAALAAVSSAQDLSKAEGTLSRALADRVGRVEVRAWRAVARSRAEYRSPQAAEQTLDDLDAVLRLRGELRGLERAARIRALLGAGRVEEAQAQVVGWTDAPADVRWLVALTEVQERLKGGTLVDLLAELRVLPEEPAPSPRRLEVAGRVRALLEVEARSRGPGSLDRQNSVSRRLASLCSILELLAPGQGLPMRLREPLLARAAGYKQPASADLGQAVAALAPNDLEVQRNVGMLAGRGLGVSDRLKIFPALRRAIALEPEREARVDLEVLLCWHLADCADTDALANGDRLIDEGLTRTSGLLPSVESSLARAQLLLSRSRLLRLRGDLEGSMRDLDAVSALKVGLPALSLYRADTLLALGRKPEAVDAAEEYLVRGGEDLTSGRAGLAMAIVWEGRERDGKPSPKTLASLERYLSFIGGYDGHPSLHRWWLRAVHLHLLAGDRPRALRGLDNLAREFDRRQDEDKAKRARALKQGIGSSDPRVCEEAVKWIAERVEELEEPSAKRQRPGHR